MQFANQSNQKGAPYKGAAYLHNLQQGSSLGPTINTLQFVFNIIKRVQLTVSLHGILPFLNIKVCFKCTDVKMVSLQLGRLANHTS